jgi:hypothetical protein
MLQNEENKVMKKIEETRRKAKIIEDIRKDENQRIMSVSIGKLTN